MSELFELIDRELNAIEAVQTKKVIDLARRLLPNLTAEDIRNPHDFPELGDPDWQYEDGVLAGIQSVRIALRAMKNRHEEEEGRIAEAPRDARVPPAGGPAQGAAEAGGRR